MIMWHVQHAKRQGARLKFLQLGFSLQFTQCKQEAVNNLLALKPWQYLSARLNCYRHHSQLSKSCVPTCHMTSSTNHVWLKAKWFEECLFCFMRQNRLCLSNAKVSISASGISNGNWKHWSSSNPNNLFVTTST